MTCAGLIFMIHNTFFQVKSEVVKEEQLLRRQPRNAQQSKNRPKKRPKRQPKPRNQFAVQPKLRKASVANTQQHTVNAAVTIVGKLFRPLEIKKHKKHKKHKNITLHVFIRTVVFTKTTKTKI